MYELKLRLKIKRSDISLMILSDVVNIIWQPDWAARNGIFHVVAPKAKSEKQ